MRRLLGLLATQSVAFLALVVALSGGTAYAVGRTVAKNTVVSRSIRDGQVKTADLANGAVTAAKLAPGAVPTTTSTPASVPFAKVAGLGGFVKTSDAGSCNPDTTTYESCETTTVDMPQSGTLLLIGEASIHHQTNDLYHATGNCQFVVDGTVLSASNTPVTKGNYDSGSPLATTTFIGVAPVASGTHTIQITCNDTYYATYSKVRITSVALGS